MISKVLALISSIVMGVSMLASPSGNQVPLAVTPQPAGTVTPGKAAPLGERRAFMARLFQGDPYVRAGLVLATVSATGLRPVEVLQGLKDGKSIAGIASAAGKTADDVLSVYDETVQYRFNQAEENGRLPAALAQSRIDWYEMAGRQMVNQPGLSPSFPGLHQLHVALIASAIKVGGLERDKVREELQACQSLNDILVENGHTGQEAVDFAMQHIDAALDRLEQAGKLSDAQRQIWGENIRAALIKMITTPGLHVAGKACSQ